MLQQISLLSQYVVVQHFHCSETTGLGSGYGAMIRRRSEMTDSCAIRDPQRRPAAAQALDSVGAGQVFIVVEQGGSATGAGQFGVGLVDDDQCAAFCQVE